MKQFCPNCEKDSECIHAAELYECQECGEDFARYIVPRTNPDYYNHADIPAETSAADKALNDAESALISMVQQYCRYNEDEEKYSHDFMSAGEEAFYYLVRHRIAKWTDNSHAFIEFVKGSE